MRALTLVLLGLAALGCSSTPETAESTSASGAFVIAALMAGQPDPVPDEAAVQEASSGHFDNMKRLVLEGHLLLAGPSGDANSQFRGLFLFAGGDVEAARELTATDPAISAGLLRAELTTLHTQTPLGELPRLVREARARRMLMNPEDPAEGFVGRPYVIATTNRGREVERKLAKMIRAGRVLFHGDLGPPAEGSAMFVLDVDSVARAEVELENAGVLKGLGASWALDLWWASEAVAELPKLTASR